MSTVHVLPVGDLIEHDDEGSDCVCVPDVEHVPGAGDGWLITHHSLDGREARELETPTGWSVKPAPRTEES